MQPHLEHSLFNVIAKMDTWFVLTITARGSYRHGPEAIEDNLYLVIKVLFLLKMQQCFQLGVPMLDNNV